jgi:hypothetical protein
VRATPSGGLRGAAGALWGSRGGATRCRQRSGEGAERHTSLGAGARSMAHVLAPNVCRVGDRVEPMFLLGAQLLGTTTRHRGLPAGGGSGTGVHRDAARVARLAKPPTLPCVDLAGRVTASGITAAPEHGAMVKQGRKHVKNP